jgi:hypothetical protein
MLPFDSAFEVALGSAPVTLDMASPPDISVDNRISGFQQRSIPEGQAFTLGWCGPIPASAFFELKELSPAVIQAGSYSLKLTWLAAERGNYVNLNALKMLDVKLPKRTIEAYVQLLLLLTESSELNDRISIDSNQIIWKRPREGPWWQLSSRAGSNVLAR